MQKCTRGIERIYEIFILILLKKESLYGYQIKKYLEEKFNCKVNFGSLYKFLNELREKNFIEVKIEKSNKGPKRKIYNLTLKGYTRLRNWEKELKDLKKTIEIILKEITNL